MKIGIIGAGAIGGNAAFRLVRAGHSVQISNSQGPHTLNEAVSRTGALAATCADAVEGADAVIFAIPFGRITDFDAAILDRRAARAPILDTTNYFPQIRDPRIEAVEAGLPDSEWVAAQLGHPVIKAFNSLNAADLLAGGERPGSDARVALPIAGAPGPAKDTAAQIVRAVGFDVVDAGELSESWRIQPGTPAFLADTNAERLRTAMSLATRQQIEEYLAARPEQLGELVRRRTALIR
jgi:predicted dinucleotide-binding enzyme